MAETSETRPSVHDSLQRVTELLHRHEVVESLVHRQQSPRQELVENLAVMRREFVKFRPDEKAEDVTRRSARA